MIDICIFLVWFYLHLSFIVKWLLFLGFKFKYLGNSLFKHGDIHNWSFYHFSKDLTMFVHFLQKFVIYPQSNKFVFFFVVSNPNFCFMHQFWCFVQILKPYSIFKLLKCRNNSRFCHFTLKLQIFELNHVLNRILAILLN